MRLIVVESEVIISFSKGSRLFVMEGAAKLDYLKRYVTKKTKIEQKANNQFKIIDEELDSVRQNIEEGINSYHVLLHLRLPKMSKTNSLSSWKQTTARV